MVGGEGGGEEWGEGGWGLKPCVTRTISHTYAVQGHIHPPPNMCGLAGEDQNKPLKRTANGRGFSRG